MSRDESHVSQEPIFRPCNVGHAEDSTWAMDTALPADGNKARTWTYRAPAGLSIHRLNDRARTVGIHGESRQ
mgnify:FL=1